MANGFLVASPGARHGASDQDLGVDWVWAQRFTCPGSGMQEISEIGLWSKDSGGEFRLAIYTDDSGNDCPEDLVANSESATLSADAAISKKSHTYSTKPELTGGVNYWLALFLDASNNIDYLDTSGHCVSLEYQTPYTWPEGDTWHGHDNRVLDVGIYAVYSGAGGGVVKELLVGACGMGGGSLGGGLNPMYG